MTLLTTPWKLSLPCVSDTNLRDFFLLPWFSRFIVSLLQGSALLSLLFLFPCSKWPCPQSHSLEIPWYGIHNLPSPFVYLSCPIQPPFNINKVKNSVPQLHQLHSNCSIAHMWLAASILVNCRTLPLLQKILMDNAGLANSCVTLEVQPSHFPQEAFPVSVRHPFSLHPFLCTTRLADIYECSTIL